MTWSPPLIVQPTFGHPYCDRCGAVIVEEAKRRHVEWHRRVEPHVETSDAASRMATEVDEFFVADALADRYESCRCEQEFDGLRCELPRDHPIPHRADIGKVQASQWIASQAQVSS